MVFDGKEYAHTLEQGLVTRFKLLRKKLKLAIWLDSANSSGAKYVQKKMGLAKRLGVEVVLNKVDGDEDGVMVQLPHPDSVKLISGINPTKDVDGLREDSPFRPAVVRAVLEILGQSSKVTPYRSIPRIVVVGDRGFVGSRLVKELKCEGMDRADFDPATLLRTDVIISATGSPSLIKPEMVKDGVIAIDVGYPQGDFDPLVADKASFFTPVPGGVGPVTVVMLFANLLEAVVE